MAFLAAAKPRGVFWGPKKTVREWGHAMPRFSIETDFFSRRKPRDAFLGAEKAPAGSTRTHTLVLGKDRSRTRRGNTTRVILLDSTNFVCYTPPCLVEPSSPGFEPGASGVRRPCARPLGNLTTVGHLAKASPDLSPHFRTQMQYFLISFQQRKIKFSDA